MTKTHTICPHCGQPLNTVRFGLRFPPIQTRILDAIVRAGPDGISRADLHNMIYGARATVRQLISVHINKINETLARGGTYRIHSTRGWYAHYSLQKIEERAA